MATHTVCTRHDLAAEAANHNMKPLTVELHDDPADARHPKSEGSVHMDGCSAHVSDGLPRDLRFSVHVRHTHTDTVIGGVFCVALCRPRPVLRRAL